MANHVPARMTCIEIAEPGPPEGLRAAERPVPDIAEGEVLIRVAAAGVNRPDLMQRAGSYPPPPGVTDIPGLEVAGTIAALGPGTSEFAVGDEVTALVAGGGYAEYCAAPLPQVLPVPKGLSMVEAAAIPETFFTVWVNVFDRARLAEGETLLVQGGASGIGTSAVMLASSLGHRVIATAGSAVKCQACRDLGAQLAINYREEDFVDAVMKFTVGRGVDVILDMVAGDYTQRNLECLAEDGRLSIIALLGGMKSEISMGRLLVKRLTITGSTLRPRPVVYKGAIAAALREHAWPLFENGAIKPVIHATIPLAEAAEAHRILEAGDHVGKVVLEV